MNNPFDGKPVEPDTRILCVKTGEVEGVPYQQEEWGWDGIYGQSLIFLRNTQIGWGEAQVVALARKICPFDSYTYSESGDFILVNFGFVISRD